MLLGEFTASFSHGLLVIAAPESGDAHAAWDAASQAVHAGPDSIYCGVRQAASGLVTVSCVDGDVAAPGLEEIFAGRLILPSARLELYDPDETIRLIVPVDGTEVAVGIHADDVEEPSRLLVRVTAPD
jgi:hypothetical protein